MDSLVALTDGGSVEPLALAMRVQIPSEMLDLLSVREAGKIFNLRYEDQDP